MNESKFQKLIFELKTTRSHSRLRNIYKEDTTVQFSKNLTDINFKKRQSIITHAYSHTALYKYRYDNCGITPEDIRTENDFNKLPIVTRDDLKNNFSDFISDDVKKKYYYKATTGGSTGVPVSVLHDKRFPIETVQWRVLDWWGLKPYDNAAFIYRLRRTGREKIINNMIWWPTKRIFLDASNMNKLTISNFIELFNKLKPKLLQGYVGAIYEFALFIKENKINIVSPKAVWVTSSILTEQQRNIMQEVFKAPVYDQYGTCEIMWLAAECKEQNGLHVMSDIRYIEFVDDNNLPVTTNNWGKILLTDFHNYVFPLIRYEIGDYGRALDQKCKCGIQLPLMDSIKGRVSDVIKTPLGKTISGEYLTTIFDDYPDAVLGFQLAQHKEYNITLRIIPNVNYSNWQNEVNTVVNNLNNLVENKLKIEVNYCSKIQSDRGKNKFIISEIN